MQKEKLTIANISGFYGDRLSAAKEMIEGGPVDFLTGDYLAELTMAILYKSKAKNPELGYARSFLKQMEGIMGSCLDKGIKVVVNAGGLNPAGLADALQKVAGTLGLNPQIAYIEGDDLMQRMTELKEKGATLRHLDTGKDYLAMGMPPVSANAYLGCWGIVEALNRGADIVLTGRVADTSVVMGPAAYHFQWSRTDWDALAGAAVAGHIIECSGQASGGNYSHFKEVPTFHRLGFPIAEMHADGSSVITKHPGTGGLVSIGTVTAQLMYEINRPAYITPDVVAHFDTISLQQEGADRVRVSGTKGSPATDTAKVTVNYLGGFQNSMNFFIAGLDIEEKAEILEAHFLQHIGGREVFDHLDFQFFPTHKSNPASNEEAMALLRVSVADANPQKAGKLFTSKMIELALSTVPGWCIDQAPGPAKPRLVHFPALLEKRFLRQQVHINGERIELEEVVGNEAPDFTSKPAVKSGHSLAGEPTDEVYLGRLYAARSGDKGGNANLGVWAKTTEAYDYLHAFLTVEKLKELLPDAAPFRIERYDFPNLLALNFYLIGFLGDGVAANTKLDGQAKTLGEYLRAKRISVPRALLT